MTNSNPQQASSTNVPGASSPCVLCSRHPYLGERCCECAQAGDYRHWDAASGVNPNTATEIAIGSLGRRFEAQEERIAALEIEVNSLQRDVGVILYPHHAADYGQLHPPKSQARQAKAVAVRGVRIVKRA